MNDLETLMQRTIFLESQIFPVFQENNPKRKMNENLKFSKGNKRIRILLLLDKP